MSKVTLKGFLLSASKIAEYQNKNGNGSTKISKLVMRVPARIDEFGEKKGEDQDFQISVMNSRLDKLPADALKLLPENDVTFDQTPKAIITAYLNSRYVTSTDKPFYSLELSLDKLEIV